MLIVSHIVSDGETNWLEGTMLLFTYFIICFAFFFYHHQEALPDNHPMKHA